MEHRMREEQIRVSLQNFDYSKPHDYNETVGDIWGGNSIFFYDKESAVKQLIEDIDSTSAERPPEFLKQVWDKKWESMDFSWF